MAEALVGGLPTFAKTVKFQPNVPPLRVEAKDEMQDKRERADAATLGLSDHSLRTNQRLVALLPPHPQFLGCKSTMALGFPCGHLARR